jgi:mono/diheme cytochrome c family protein
LRGIRFNRAGRPRRSRGAALLAVVLGAGSVVAQHVGPDAPPLTVDEARTLKSPIPSAPESIARGKRLYQTHGCANCHGTDGKALIEVVANATDLTDPTVWKNGTEEGLVFRSIRDGAGLAMPPFRTEVADPGDLWHLVNFVRSLWP